ncbi:MAG: hypothetical protein Q8S73_26525 [Deltaproteobacteria bacterium]|nr:hypothetical protein [Myxococcales bacterium]MDP3217691.1 hypothetical protein [Deltaproteobacteria bacterium]
MTPVIEFRLDLNGLEEEARSFLRYLDAEMNEAMRLSGRAIAEEARASHSFQNQTGDLEDSIRGLRVTGRATDGTLAGGAEAVMPYASYVEAWSEYLGTAFVLRSDEIDRRRDDAVENAVFRSGLR